jgi:hypothetical protein
MEVLQLSVSKRSLNNSSNNSSRSAKLRSRIIDNSRRRSPSKLRLSNSRNLRIINRRNNNLSRSRSVDNSRRSTDKLRLSSICNMRISNRRNSSLSSSRRRSVLTLLSLTTRLAQTAMQTKLLASAYKCRRQVHTSSNGTRGRLG